MSPESTTPLPAPAVQTAAVSRRWKVTQRTAQRWVKRWGAEVVADEVQLASKLLGDRNTPSEVRRVAAQALAGRAIRAATTPSTSVSEDPQVAAGDLRARLTGLEAHLAWVDEQLRVAQELKDQADVITWSRLYRELSEAVVRNRLAQAKLGIDSGELIPRADFARLVWAIASRAAVGIQRTRDELAPTLVAVSSSEEAAALLEPRLISQLFLAPFARAANLAAGVGLPSWVVDDLRETVADHLAAGATELAAARVAEATTP